MSAPMLSITESSGKGTRVDHLEQLRAAMAAVDPRLLTGDDRRALLDLFQVSSSVADSAA